MAETVYEGMFILDTNKYKRDQTGTAEMVKALVEKHGGEVLVTRLWDERKLAYPIKGQKRGTYWLTYFRMAGDGLTGLTQESDRSDAILRHLFLKIDPRIVDTLVQHAQSSGETATPAAEEEAAEEKADEKKTEEKASEEPAAEGDSTEPVAEATGS